MVVGAAPTEHVVEVTAVVAVPATAQASVYVIEPVSQPFIAEGSITVRDVYHVAAAATEA